MFAVVIPIEKDRVEAAIVIKSGDTINANQKLQRFNMNNPIPVTIDAMFNMIKLQRSTARPIMNISR